MKKELYSKQNLYQSLKDEEKVVLHKNAHVKIQSDEAINIYECENASLSKLQNIKIEEIMKFENSKIEVNNGMEKDKMIFEDQLRKIEDSMVDCNMKME